MVILGIDPALSITGYGLIRVEKPQACRVSVSGGKISLLEAGVIITKSSQPVAQRLNKIYQALCALIAELKPDVLVLEKIYAHYRHPVTSYLLGQARGVICLASAVCNIELVEYAATRVKKSVVGKGLAPKQQVQRMVAKLLSLESLPKYSDVTDALALAIAHYYIITSNSKRLFCLFSLFSLFCLLTGPTG